MSGVQTKTTLGVTTRLCENLVDLYARPLPAPIEREARRSLFNVVGTAIGASRSDAVEIVAAYAATSGGAPVAGIPGRAERTDPLNAALATGLAAHYDDYDDTHLLTVIHPSAATAAAVLSFGAWRGATGSEALRAFALGCEAQLQVGVALSPSHYDAGWHITGTCGPVGATVAVGLLAGFDVEELRAAIGLAASQTLGMREAFGTMTKPFHPGKAAANGLLSVLLVEGGVSAPPDAIEASDGLFGALCDEPEEKLLGLAEGFGENWELLRNTYKPYPCGIVSHPALDAATALHPRLEYPERIERVVVSCHPLVAELTGNRNPTDGLEAKFSTIHGVAAGLLDGSVGIAQYDDERVQNADVARLRERIELRVDPSLARDAAAVEVFLPGEGSFLFEEVEHARGSLERPLTDGELHTKVAALVEPLMPGAAGRIEDAVGSLRDQPNLCQLVEACTPDTAEKVSVQ